MSAASPQFATTLSLSEMQALIDRVVKEAVHEEFARALQPAPISISEDWSHEGIDDPDDDRLLLAEALALREQYRTEAGEWMEWNAFKTDLRAMDMADEPSD